MLTSSSLRMSAAVAALGLLADCASSQMTPLGAAVQAAASSPVQSIQRTGARGVTHLFGPFANPKLNALVAGLPALGSPRHGSFVAVRPAKKQENLLVASSEYQGIIDVYDVNSGDLLASCSYCGGWGVAVNKKNGDLAVGTQSSTVSVYHRTNYFTQFATLTLTGSSWDPIGVAYDAKGGVYVGNLVSNEIDYFSAATIAAGGGTADEKLYPPDLFQVYFLTTNGNTLIADGVQPSTDNIVTVSIKSTKKGTTDKILQSSAYGTAFPGGLAVDDQHNLTINNQLGSTATYAEPWTGTPVRSLDWYDGGYSDYTGIALSKDQQTLYSANVIAASGTYTDVVYGTYDPLGEFGSTAPTADELYIGVASDPATGN